MNRKLQFVAPRLQVEFAYRLKEFRNTRLQDALFETLKGMKITEIDKQLAQYVSDRDLVLMAQFGLRGEVLFAVPLILEQNPRLVGYYRLLLGYSQKEFYGKAFGAGCFRDMETDGEIDPAVRGDIPELCTAFCGAASALLHDIEPLEPSKELLDDLTLLTVGPQLRGGANNKRGTEGIDKLYKIICQIVGHAAVNTENGKSIEIRNAAGQKVLIEFGSDPDIIIREEMKPGNFRKLVAIEVKSGTDISNIHNRIGEAEKSHQKARKNGFTEFWTILNATPPDMDKAKSESPSTNIFYSLNDILSGKGEKFDDFRQRIISLTSITEA